MSDFKLNFRESRNTKIIDIKGYLDAHTAPELENAIQNLIKNKNYQIVVNFKNLSYISSAGLGVFNAYIEEVRENNGDIKLTNMSPKIYNVFDILGFPMIYEIYKDETEALNKFSKKKMNKSALKISIDLKLIAVLKIWLVSESLLLI